jgi:hypothetical protein
MVRKRSSVSQGFSVSPSPVSQPLSNNSVSVVDRIPSLKNYLEQCPDSVEDSSNNYNQTIYIHDTNMAKVRVATLNIGGNQGLSSEAVLYIGALFQDHHWDVLVLTDTKLDTHTSQLRAKQIIQELGPATAVVQNPISSTSLSHPPSHGGMMVIVRDTWAGASTDIYRDPTGVGVVTSITLKGQHDQRITIIGSYWIMPMLSTSMDLKAAKHIEHYCSLHPVYNSFTAIQYIQSLITTLRVKYVRSNDIVLLFGCLQRTVLAQTTCQGTHSISEWTALLTSSLSLLSLSERSRTRGHS